MEGMTAEVNLVKKESPNMGTKTTLYFPDIQNIYACREKRIPKHGDENHIVLCNF